MDGWWVAWKSGGLPIMNHSVSLASLVEPFVAHSRTRNNFNDKIDIFTKSREIYRFVIRFNSLSWLIFSPNAFSIVAR